MSRTGWAVVLASLVLAVARPAIAQSPAAPVPEPASAAPAPDERVRQAAEAYDRGEFDRALELLQAAYADAPKPALLFNMAQVQRSKNDCATAAATYRRFIDTTTADDPNRTRAERYESDMLACAARATSAPAIERAPTASGPPLSPRPAAARATPAIQVTHPVPAPPDQPEPTWSARRITAYALVGAGIVAAGASGVMALKARSTALDVVDNSEQPERERKFEREQTWARVLGGAALVSAGAGVTLLLF